MSRAVKIHVLTERRLDKNGDRHTLCGKAGYRQSRTSFLCDSGDEFRAVEPGEASVATCKNCVGGKRKYSPRAHA